MSLGRLVGLAALLLALAAAALVLVAQRPWENAEIALGPTSTVTLTVYPTWTPSLTPPPSATPTTTSTFTPTPLPSATPLVIPSATPAFETYTVVDGDYPERIADKTGVSVEALLTANGLTVDSILHIGQELLIPLGNGDLPVGGEQATPAANSAASPTAAISATAAPKVEPTASAAPSPTALVHVVQAGDMLGTLAMRYDVSVEEIAAANNITLQTILRVGQELVIPAEGLAGNALPTATPEPTATASITPTPSPTRLSAGKPTAPAFPFRPVVILAPVDGFAANGTDVAVILNWTSVGILGADQWYQLSLWPPGQGDPEVYYTKATSWRLDAEVYAPKEAVYIYEWQVRVAYRPAGATGDVALSLPSERHTFLWR